MQKQYESGSAIFLGWLLAPVSKSLVSYRCCKISDQIPPKKGPDKLESVSCVPDYRWGIQLQWEVESLNVGESGK